MSFINYKSLSWFSSELRFNSPETFLQWHLNSQKLKTYLSFLCNFLWSFSNFLWYWTFTRNLFDSVCAVKSPESLGSHLASLLLEAEHRVQELGGSTSGSGGTTLLEPPSSHRSSFSSQHNNLTGCGGSAEDKQLALWERRARALRKMLLGFDQASKSYTSIILILYFLTRLKRKKKEKKNRI